MRTAARRTNRRRRRGISPVIVVLGIVGVAAVGLLLWKKFGKGNFASTANTEKARYEDGAGQYKGLGSPATTEEASTGYDPQRGMIPANPYGGDDRYGSLQGLKQNSDAAYSRLVGAASTGQRDNLTDLQKRYSTANGAYNDRLGEYSAGGW